MSPPTYVLGVRTFMWTSLVYCSDPRNVNLLLAVVPLAAVCPTFRLRHPCIPAVTIASVTLMAVLFISEMLMFVKVDTSSHMAVADFHDHDAVTARLHVTFPYIGCKGERT